MPLTPSQPIRRWLARVCRQRMVAPADRAIPPAIRLAVLPPLVLTAALAALGGCSHGQQFKPACPALSLVKNAADLTRFAPGGGRDITDMVIDARITAVPAKCEAGDPGIVKATMSVEAEVLRGPAAKTRSGDVVYFVAVTQGERILDEQDYGLRVTFPSNIDRVTAKGDDIVLALPVTKEKSAAAYQIYVGFRLSPEELQLNRARGVR